MDGANEDGLAFRKTSRGIHYGSRGAGGPVVLLHGWCLNRTLWAYQEAHLLSEHRVLTPDLPGFGRSADLAGPYDLDRYATELAAFLEELGLEDASIVGFAFGAAVAMAATACDASRVGRLVLIGVPSAAAAPYAKMPRAMRSDWPDFARRSAVAICRQPQSEATIGWLATMFGSTPLPVALETVALLGRFEPVPLAGDVRVPALLVHGADDDVVPVAVSQACADRMPEGRLETVPDCGHLVVLDQKDALNALLDDFLPA